jgi:hypothetical protein
MTRRRTLTAYKLLAVPRGVMAAGNVMAGGRGGVDLPEKDDEARPSEAIGSEFSTPVLNRARPHG